MVVNIEGGGDLTTNARPTLQLRASDGHDASLLLRFAVLVTRGHAAARVLQDGVDALEPKQKETRNDSPK